MPSRKQRRRRAKERRHDYELVYVDEGGHEVEVDPEELQAQKERKKEAPKQAASASRDGRKPAARGAVRPVPPPSWPRVIKRAAIVAPLMLVGLTLLAHKLTWTQRISETVFLVVLFVPFAYMIDRMMYRRYLKQTGQEPPERPARKPRERSG